MINQMASSNNSNIFSETTQINALINIPNNNMTQTEEEISNININNSIANINSNISSVKTCPYCGTINNSSNTNCINCGNSLGG